MSDEASGDGPALAGQVVRLLAGAGPDAGGNGHGVGALVPHSSEDKRWARLNCIAHFLSVIPYKQVKRRDIELPQRDKNGAYDDTASIAGRRFIEQRF